MNLTHVPYKGSGPALTDLLAGRLTLMVDTAPAVLQYIKAGKVKVLAVTKPSRTTILPDVPTVSESGYPGFDAQAWLGFLAPRGTPQATIDTLAKASTQILASKSFVAKMASLGAEPVGGTQAEFAVHISTELKRWKGVIEKIGIEKQ
jgi:tripartite-type tricarboxylate transporter receptor subunit TctC